MSGDLTAAVAAGALLAPGRPVLVMLSGGRDSVCLLDVAARIAGPGAVAALHVNYGLRGAAADADAEHCERLCEQLGVLLTVRRASGPPPTSRNTQAWARELRYAAAEELAAPETDIATGHTATDQVETILYRLASSPSRRALLGMKPRDGRLVRPLLSYTREDTAGHCRGAGLSWREDETNDGDEYARGRIRRVLVPALRQVHPAAEANVLAVAEILREEAEVLDELVDAALAGRDRIELAELRRLPLPVARLLVQRLADRAAGRPAPGTARRTTELLVLKDRASLDLPHGVKAVVDGGSLHFECPYNRST